MWPFRPQRQLEQPPSAPQTRPPVTLRLRSYAAAAINRLTSDWNAPDTTADLEIEAALPLLRQRARDMERNNDYVRRYFHLLTTNVVGKNGIGLQVRCRDINGKLDTAANAMIEDRWARWGAKGNCTVCGRYSWIDVQNLCLRAVARDGEILLYMPSSWAKNESGFGIQLIEADHLDIRLNRVLANGNTIRMGVEFNEDHRPVAYHVTTKHPADYGYRATENQRLRIHADDIIHLRRPERVDETRSAPWITSVAPRLRQIAAAEEAEVVAWRIAASKMGFYTRPEDGPEYPGDRTDADGNPIAEAEPGVFETLDPGWGFQEWNPDKPASTVESFLKAELRGVASGLNVSYVALSNNLEGVSYSSIRSGEMADRDHWRVLQTWMIEHLCAEVWQRWLRRVLLTAYLPLPASKLAKWDAPVWRPRGWEWVDPSNESAAADADVRMGVESLEAIASKRGNDLEDVFAANQRARELADQYGVTLSVFQPKEISNGSQP